MYNMVAIQVQLDFEIIHSRKAADSDRDIIQMRRLMKTRMSTQEVPKTMRQRPDQGSETIGTNTDRHNPVDNHDRCYPYPNRTVTVIMYLIRMTTDYPNFLRTKKMALAVIFLWPLHQYHILRMHINIF